MSNAKIKLPLYTPCTQIWEIVVRLHLFLTSELERWFINLTLRPLWGHQSFSKRFGEEEMFLALPGVEPRVAQSIAVLRESKCENNVVTGPSRSDVKLWGLM